MTVRLLAMRTFTPELFSPGFSISRSISALEKEDDGDSLCVLVRDA